MACLVAVKQKSSQPPLSPPALDAVRLYLRVARRDIAYLKFIIESYEGIAVVRTEDKRAGIIMLLVVPDFQAELEAILEELGREIAIEVIERPPGI